MAKLRFVWIIHTTSTVANADSDSNLRLELDVGNPVATNLFFQFDADEMQSGETKQQRFTLPSSTLINMNIFGPSRIFINISGNDAWLPSSIWAIGEDVNGDRKLLAGVPNWPTSVANGWFSTDLTEGQPRRSLAT